MQKLSKNILFGKLVSVWILKEERFVKRKLQQPIWEISLNIILNIISLEFVLMKS